MLLPPWGKVGKGVSINRSHSFFYNESWQNLIFYLLLPDEDPDPLRDEPEDLDCPDDELLACGPAEELLTNDLPEELLTCGPDVEVLTCGPAEELLVTDLAEKLLS
jgi:hypothetical protein